MLSWWPSVHQACTVRPLLRPRKLNSPQACFDDVNVLRLVSTRSLLLSKLNSIDAVALFSFLQSVHLSSGQQQACVHQACSLDLQAE